MQDHTESGLHGGMEDCMSMIRRESGAPSDRVNSQCGYSQAHCKIVILMLSLDNGFIFFSWLC